MKILPCTNNADASARRGTDVIDIAIGIGIGFSGIFDFDCDTDTNFDLRL
jgi:hypothetical protein